MGATLDSVVAVASFRYPLHLCPQVRGGRRRQAKAWPNSRADNPDSPGRGDIDQNPYGTRRQPTLFMRSPVGACARCEGFDLNLPLIAGVAQSSEATTNCRLPMLTPAIPRNRPPATSHADGWRGTSADAESANSSSSHSVISSTRPMPTALQ